MMIGQSAGRVRARRIQRSGRPGWTMPADAVDVGPGTPFGNPYEAGEPHPETGRPMTAADTVSLYERALTATDVGRAVAARFAEQLAGRTLVCRCPVSAADGTPVPCHADVLLRLANREAPPMPSA